MNLQAAYDLDVATRASADKIARDVRSREAASINLDTARLRSHRREQALTEDAIRLDGALRNGVAPVVAEIPLSGQCRHLPVRLVSGNGELDLD